jgi:hypothetical protein
MLALLGWPVLLALRSATFETQRWSESDHSSTSSGGDEEDDGPAPLFEGSQPPITLGLSDHGRDPRQEGNR